MTDESWKSVQMRTFTKWLNAKLGTSVTNLPLELSDGLLLDRLLVKLCPGPPLSLHDPATSRFQKVENVQRVLDRVAQGGVRLINIGSVDIVDQSEKLVLGLLWAIILRFSILKNGTVATDRALLAWAQAAAGRKVRITDFSTSWADGRAFCGVLRRFVPDLVPESFLSTDNDPAHVLEHAFGVAENLGVARLLDVQDLVATSRPDSKSVMTYVAALYDRFRSASLVSNTSFLHSSSLLKKSRFAVFDYISRIKGLRSEANVIAQSYAQLMEKAQMLAFGSARIHSALDELKLQAAAEIGALHSVEAALGTPLTDCGPLLTEIHQKDKNLVTHCDKCFSVLQNSEKEYRSKEYSSVHTNSDNFQETPNTGVFDISQIQNLEKTTLSKASHESSKHCFQNNKNDSQNIDLGNLDAISVCSSGSDLSEFSSESLATDKNENSTQIETKLFDRNKYSSSLGNNNSTLSFSSEQGLLRHFPELADLYTRDPGLFSPFQIPDNYEDLDEKITFLQNSGDLESQINKIQDQISKCCDCEYSKLLKFKKEILEQVEASKETENTVTQALEMFDAVDFDKTGKILVPEAESIFCVLGIKHAKTGNMDVQIIKNERTKSFSEYISKESFISETRNRYKNACSLFGIQKKIEELKKNNSEDENTSSIQALEEILQKLSM